MKIVSIVICSIFFINNLMQSSLSKIIKPPKIAIIGGGIGGASTAHFLNELFRDDNANIHVYEREIIGGRLATTNINGRYFEVGGSVIHPRNKYISQFMDLFGLKKRFEKPSSTFALYDGEKFVFQSSEYYLINVIKVLWRYGLDFKKLDSTIDSILKLFDRIYELQGNGKSFKTVEQLLNAMSPSFVNALTNTTYKVLKDHHFSDRMINEIVRAALRVNYGQDIDVHFFVGSVSLAGTADELFSIKGGNKQIPEKLLQRTSVVTIPRGIQNITLNLNSKAGSRYLLNFTHNENQVSDNEHGEFYDIVILATPMTLDIKNRIKFINFPKQIKFLGNYHRTVCTLVNGDLNYKFFNMDSKITDILTVNDTFFNSISSIVDVNYTGDDIDSNVWKIFSKNILTEAEMNKLFKNIKSKKIIDWLAYPAYDTMKRTDSFVLDDYMFHVNAIEWAASAMEMSAIGAKNVAILAYEAWTNTKFISKNNQTNHKEQKVEL